MPSLSVIIRSVSPTRGPYREPQLAFTERGQHGDCQPLEPGVPGALLAQYSLGIQRRAARRLSHQLLTHLISPHRHRLSLSPEQLPTT
jgi:hypothetical protein